MSPMPSAGQIIPSARTIPALLKSAAERDPGGVWLRADDTELTFAAAVAAVAGVAANLREAGVRRDLVVMTARTTPPYLLCWLALASLGAVTAATNPRSAPAELAGLIQQTSPRVLITDVGLAGLVDAAGVAAWPGLDVLDVAELTAPGGAERDLPDAGVQPDDVAAVIPTSGTTGRSKLVMQT